MVLQDQNGTVEAKEFVQYFSDALSDDPDEFNSTMEDFMEVPTLKERSVTFAGALLSNMPYSSGGIRLPSQETGNSG